MPNSDNQDGVFNKMTREIRYYHNNGDLDTLKYAEEPVNKSVVTQSFGGNIETAKSHFFHADALTNNDTNGTQLDYAITDDGNGIKFTIAFGTKGAGTAEADDWADKWRTTKDSLVAANKWIKATTYTYGEKDEDVGVTYPVGWKSIDATPHLF